MLKRLLLLIMVACLMTGCTQNGSQEDSSGIETTDPISNSDSESEISLQQSSPTQELPESQDEEHPEESDNDTTDENNPTTNQSPISDSNNEAFAYDEQALDAELEYLESILSASQHGGMHRISDYNGSGRAYHGGDDKANPYILVWVVDKNAVDAAVNNYTGQKVEVIFANANYSFEQLNTIKTELETGEISNSINSIFISEDNKVVLDIIGQENLNIVNNYLASYQDSDAVDIFAR